MIFITIRSSFISFLSEIVINEEQQKRDREKSKNEYRIRVGGRGRRGGGQREGGRASGKGCDRGIIYELATEGKVPNDIKAKE